MHWVSFTPAGIAWRTNSLRNSWRTLLEPRSPPQRGPVQIRTCFLKGRFNRESPPGARPGTEPCQTRRSLDLEYRLELQAGVERQLGHSHDDPRVLPAVPVEFHEDLGGPFHHLEGVEEARSGGQVSDDLDDAPDPIEVLDRLLGGGQEPEGGEPRRLDALLDGHFPSDGADVFELAVLFRQLSRKEQEVPGTRALDVGPEGLADLGQMPTQGLQGSFNLAWHRRALRAPALCIAGFPRRRAPRRQILAS